MARRFDFVQNYCCDPIDRNLLQEPAKALQGSALGFRDNDHQIGDALGRLHICGLLGRMKIDHDVIVFSAMACESGNNRIRGI
jgi:hypothetical protein